MKTTTLGINFCSNFSSGVPANCLGGCSACDMSTNKGKCIAQLPATYSPLPSYMGPLGMTIEMQTTAIDCPVTPLSDLGDDPNPLLHFVASKITIYLVCNKTVKPGVLSFKPASQSTCAYNVTFTSEHACPTGGMDPGWIFVIIVLCVFSIYCIAGSILNWRMKGAKGVEVVPNYEFWKEFPGYVKDGSIFVFRTVTCRKGDYEKV